MKNLESPSVLYGAIRKEHADRAEAFRNLAGHPDQQKDYDLHTKALADLIRDYRAAGGKRDVSKYH